MRLVVLTLGCAKGYSYMALSEPVMLDIRQYCINIRSWGERGLTFRII